jgi:hypothetical protein
MIKQRHAQYGPIIRIAPNKFHFGDTSVYKAIYTYSDLGKEPTFYRFLGPAIVGQLDVSKMKRNRQIFATYFTANSIWTRSKVKGILWEKTIIFTRRSQF